MKTILFFAFFYMSMYGAAMDRLQPRKLEPLKPGERAPDLHFRTVLNHSAKELRLSDFKGKAILLDYWGTWCIPCQRSLPKLKALKDQFGDDLIVLAISVEEIKTVARFLELKGDFPFPAVIETDGAVVTELFPFRAVPHYVLLDRQHRLRKTGSALPTAADITASNFETVPVAPTGSAINQPADSSRVLYKSVFSSYDPTQDVGNTVFTSGPYEGRRAIAKNSSIAAMYRIAYKDDQTDMTSFPFERVVIEASKPARITAPKDASGVYYRAWAAVNGYNYELIVPDEERKNFGSIMAAELDRFFKLRSRIEYRKTNCLVLSRVGKNRFASNNENRRAEASMFWMNYRSQPMSNFRAALYRYSGIAANMSVIDETGYSGNVDISIKANMADVVQVSAALEAYGLKLTVEQRELKMLIISEQ